jgi:hypothetical protein
MGFFKKYEYLKRIFRNHYIRILNFPKNIEINIASRIDIRIINSNYKGEINRNK